MALHTGIAAFHCGECGKAFITRDKLLLHQKSRHSNERPHACEWCGKGFLLAHKLAEHRRRVHTGEKPFKCNMCDQRFTDSRYVKYFIFSIHFQFFHSILLFSVLCRITENVTQELSTRHRGWSPNKPLHPPMASKPSSWQQAATKTKARSIPRMRPQQLLPPWPAARP